MKLYKIKIQNFKKLNNVEVLCADATFLIGANNSGKSSTLEAIELLLNGSKLTSEHRSKYYDAQAQQELTDNQDIIIEGEFREVPPDIIDVHGFNRQRLKVYRDESGNEKYSFNYRIRFGSDNKSHNEMQLHKQKLMDVFAECKSFQEFITQGANAELFAGKDITKRYASAAAIQKEIEDIAELHEVLEEEEWIENPGGIPGNVISQLPRFLKIKADVSEEEMGEKSGALYDILDLLFTDVRDQSQNYQQAVHYLELLQQEMDPNDGNSEFGKMMNELNNVVDGVFPKSKINVSADLTKADSLKAKYTIRLCSNVETPVIRQGTGMVRSAVFALLRYKKIWEEQKERKTRGVIIGFEEPELFLHPNAAENMRSIIYTLSGDTCQIIATTHSPYMIDLSQNKTQVLNSFSLTEKDYSKVIAFNHSEAFRNILEDDRAKVKMIQKIDDYVARVFFAHKALIIEGDTEDIVFKKTISLMPEGIRKRIQTDYQIIKANGKATIISFVRYLKALNVNIYVVHDEDAATKGAVIMNQPILEALDNDSTKRLMMHNCIEDELGYNAPSYDKPYKAYQFVDNWNTWDDVPDNWKSKVQTIFAEYFS